MSREQWRKPVKLVLRRGSRRLIGDVRTAMAVLAWDWPIGYGGKFENALATCAAVIEGRALAEEARSALIEAAEEALIPIIDGDQVELG